VVCGNARVKNSELNFVKSSPEMVPHDMLPRISFLSRVEERLLRWTEG